MKATQLFAVTLAVLGFSSLVDAHTYLSSVQIDNKQYQDTECIRPIAVGIGNSPITDVKSKEMTCGHLPQASTSAGKNCPARARSKITFQWHHNGNASNDDIIDKSHKGPIMVYMAPLKTNGNGRVWFKIFEKGLKGDTWAVDDLIANRGRLTVTLPKSIPSGKYILRTELLALHSAGQVAGAQFYVNCVQIDYKGGKGKKMPTGVALPGAYKANNPGILFELYYPKPTKYIIPGPRVTVK